MKRLESFFDEIYGFDGMSSFLLFISVILNLVTGMWPSQAVNNFNLISYLPLLGCIFRVFHATMKEERMKMNASLSWLVHCVRILLKSVRNRQRPSYFASSNARFASRNSEFQKERERWRLPAQNVEINS